MGALVGSAGEAGGHGASVRVRRSCPLRTWWPASSGRADDAGSRRADWQRTGRSANLHISYTTRLTGWEPTVQKPLPFPDSGGASATARIVSEAGHAGAGHLGNPPYNGYAGTGGGRGGRNVGVRYRTIEAGLRKPEGQGLNDLYVRFFRMAERRITREDGTGACVKLHIADYVVAGRCCLSPV